MRQMSNVGMKLAAPVAGAALLAALQLPPGSGALATGESVPRLQTTSSARLEAKLPLSQAEFDRLFPERHPLYSYSALAQAASRFPVVFNTGSDVLQRREFAAFLANVSHETGQFRHVREANENNWPLYCQAGAVPCAEGAQYFGRGPIQLSWNYNYAAAGRALGIDLLRNPDLVEKDPVVAWSTALWFWTTQTGAGSMTAHQAMVTSAGFGETTRSINGVLECSRPIGDPGHEQMRHRRDLYLAIAEQIGVPPGSRLGC